MGTSCSSDADGKPKRKKQYEAAEADPHPTAAADAGGGAGTHKAAIGPSTSAIVYHSTFDEKPLIFSPGSEVMSMARLASDGSVFVGSDSGVVSRLNLSTGTLLHCFDGANKLHTRDVNMMVACDATNSIFTASRDKTVRHIRARDDGQYDTSIFNGHTLNVTCVTSSPDGTRAVSGSRDNTVRLWDVERQSCLDAQDEKLNIVHCCKWIESLGVVAQGGEDLTVRLWDYRSNGGVRLHVAHTLAHFDYHPICCELLPDGVGHTLLTGHNGFNGCGCMVTIWDLRMLKQIDHMRGHDNTVRWLSSPAEPTRAGVAPGMQMFSASDDGTIREWNVAARAEMKCNRVPEGRITTIVDLGKWDLPAVGGGHRGPSLRALAVATRDGPVVVLGVGPKDGAHTRLRVFGSAAPTT